MPRIEAGLMRRLAAVADRRFGGHLTVLEFTADWRVSFGTPSDRDSTAAVAAGNTFRETALRALAAIGDEGVR